MLRLDLGADMLRSTLGPVRRFSRCRGTVRRGRFSSRHRVAPRAENSSEKSWAVFGLGEGRGLLVFSFPISD